MDTNNPMVAAILQAFLELQEAGKPISWEAVLKKLPADMAADSGQAQAAFKAASKVYEQTVGKVDKIVRPAMGGGAGGAGELAVAGGAAVPELADEAINEKDLAKRLTALQAKHDKLIADVKAGGEAQKAELGATREALQKAEAKLLKVKGGGPKGRLPGSFAAFVRSLGFREAASAESVEDAMAQIQNELMGRLETTGKYQPMFRRQLPARLQELGAAGEAVIADTPAAMAALAENLRDPKAAAGPAGKFQDLVNQINEDVKLSEPRAKRVEAAKAKRAEGIARSSQKTEAFKAGRAARETAQKELATKPGRLLQLLLGGGKSTPSAGSVVGEVQKKALAPGRGGALGAMLSRMFGAPAGSGPTTKSVFKHAGKAAGPFMAWLLLSELLFKGQDIGRAKAMISAENQVGSPEQYLEDLRNAKALSMQQANATPSPDIAELVQSLTPPTTSNQVMVGRHPAIPQLLALLQQQGQ